MNWDTLLWIVLFLLVVCCVLPILVMTMRRGREGM
jgi:Mg2+ and Co2+ transporter CorA